MHISENIIEVFKETDPRMQSHAGRGKIFFHTKCTGNRASYDIQTINRLFETGFNPEHLLQRMISLMSSLQIGYESGQYEGPLARYAGATTEFPKLYEILRDGLSDGAIEKIRTISMHEWTRQLRDNLGAMFVMNLERERRLLLSPHEQTNYVFHPLWVPSLA